jgi:hypothetical protein
MRRDMKTISITFAMVPLLAMLFLQVAVSAQTVPSRQPEPSPASQEAAQKLVNEVYRAEIQKAKSTEQKLGLALKLMQIGLETRNDATGQYVLLKMASDLAVQECDTVIALKCVESLARSFEVDLLKSKASVLTRISRNATLPNQHRL